LKAVHIAAKDAGLTSLELSGAKRGLAKWQKGGADVLVVQIQSGAEGIDLTRAHYAIYYSLGFSLGGYEQSLARIHRPGQKSKVTYYHLIVDKSVDVKVYKALKNKKKVIDAMLEEYSGKDVHKKDAGWAL
jgi:SNF2 family DNA or RNA helicase